MSVHAGKRAEWWFGKRTKAAPGSEHGTDSQGRYGQVSRTHRWFSYDWWFGHHFDREPDGTWKDDGGPKRQAGWETTYKPRSKPQTAAQRRQTAQRDYADYLHERYLAAEKATRGNMVTAAGKAKGYGGADFFDADARRRPGARWMSDELRAWFGRGDAAAGEHGGRGGILSFTRWQAQTSERAA